MGVLPNGVYLQDHSAERVEFGCRTVGYLGHMAYPPNIRAALRLQRIFLATHDRLSNTKLVIIGRDPAPEIMALAADKRVIVTGTVENIWPYVNGVDVFAFPMETGSGQQNKLLEAMGAAKPVVSSALGNSGIGAKHGESILEVDSDEEIANAIVRLVSDPLAASSIGNSAKRFVEETYSWSSMLRRIDRTLLNVQSPD